MKKLYFVIIFSILFISLQSCMVSNKPKMDFFSNTNYELKGAKFTSINVPMFLAKPIVKRSLRDDGESEELINLIKKVSDVKVMTVENGSQEMVADYAKFLTKNNYEEWMTVKKENEYIRINANNNSDTYVLEIAVKDGKYKFTLINYEGHSGGYSLSLMDVPNMLNKEGKLKWIYGGHQNNINFLNNLNKNLKEFITKGFVLMMRCSKTEHHFLKLRLFRAGGNPILE